jgi:hypothetical protein
MSAFVGHRYGVVVDPHAYIAEMRSALCDPDSGVVTHRKRQDEHKVNEMALTRLGHEIAASHRKDLEDLLRDLDIPRPERVVPIVNNSFMRAAGNLSVASDRYARGQFSLAGYHRNLQRRILEAFWKEFLELGRSLPATLHLRKNLPILYLSAEDYAFLVAEFSGQVNPGVITRFVVNSPKHARQAIDQFVETVEKLTAEYGSGVDPSVIKHFATHRPNDTRQAINQFLKVVDALTARYGSRVDPSVIKRCAMGNPSDPGKAIDARLTSVPVKQSVGN